MTSQEISESLKKFYANGGKDTDLAMAFMLVGVPELLRLAEAGRNLAKDLDMVDRDLDGKFTQINETDWKSAVHALLDTYDEAVNEE